jgi:hypothetical protein
LQREAQVRVCENNNKEEEEEEEEEESWRMWRTIC